VLNVALAARLDHVRVYENGIVPLGEVPLFRVPYPDRFVPWEKVDFVLVDRYAYGDGQRVVKARLRTPQAFSLNVGLEVYWARSSSCPRRSVPSSSTPPSRAR
jgi:hypothetical protein